MVRRAISTLMNARASTIFIRTYASVLVWRCVWVQVSDVDPDDVKKEEKRQKAGEIEGSSLHACVLARKPARAGLCVISLQNKSIAPH